MEQRIRVLIADENEKSRNELKENLARYGIDVVDETDNGADVFSKIKRTSPDIVLIDVWLPKLDTVQIIKKSKQLFSNMTLAPDFIVFLLLLQSESFSRGNRSRRRLLYAKAN